MVISNLLGGLGNQMFQYAAGRALSLHIGCDFRLDTRGFSNYKLHNGFEISRVFGISPTTATDSDIRQALGWRSTEFALKFLRRFQFGLLTGNALRIERSFEYCPNFWLLNSPIYLLGYWQSEQYFKKYEGNIRDDFKFQVPTDSLIIDILSRIECSNSIALHVRRGDYITCSATAAIMEVCPVEYYIRAISLVGRRIENPKFYVFSDDIDWCKYNIPIEFPVEYISGNRGSRSYIDMQLMSACKHQIISNSSFSWWAAWLNSNPWKIVVAPKKWFRKSPCNFDVIPSEWISL